ncbi:MAG: hypothetical protein AB7O96_18920 [Pseudobdellovibrionaceae bacterium]
MNTMVKIISLLIFSLAFADAPLKFDYADLTLRDIDEFESFAKAKSKEAEEANSSDILVMTLEVVLARPDRSGDGVVRKTLPIIKNVMEDMKVEEKVVREIVARAIKTLKEPKASEKIKQISYLIVLENLMSELRPRIKSDKWVRDVFEKIRDADLEISSEAKKETWKTMKDPISPSETAKKILPKPKDD